jgi:TldD protein
MSRSRREFVKLASTATAATAASIVWPTRAIAGLNPAHSVLAALGIEDRVGFDPGELAALALDAARAAGASFADVRIDRQIAQGVSLRNVNGGSVGYNDNVGIGVRVIADGQWGFVSSDSTTPDAVADAARRAVHQAQVNAKARTTPIALAPLPAVADGRWVTPVVVDPFGVAVGEQQEALLAGTKAALALSGIKEVLAGVTFMRVERLFASTDGSRIAQTFSRAFPNASVRGTVAGELAMATTAPKGFDWAAGGYEVVRDAKLAETMRAAAEEALRESQGMLGATAPRSVDVGRYELVVGPGMMWGLVNGTILAALGMERALGKRAGAEGTTYAAPPDKAMGTMQMGAPFLTVRGERSAVGGLMTVGWDDEGVKPDDVTFVEHGTLVDYLAMREDATALAPWYATRGMPAHAHGVAATGRWSVPNETTPNITVDPGVAAVSTEDLIRDVKHGLYFPDGGASADFAMQNAYGTGSGAQEIRNGKLVGHVKDAAIQFQTQTFWKGLLAIGGPGSSESFVDGFPALFACRTVRSVPARFRDVNVVNTGRTQ